MAVSSLLSVTLCLLVFFHACFAQVDQQLPWQSPYQQQQQQQQLQQHRQRARGDCRIDQLNPQEPTRRVRAEAGVTEIWDEDNNQLQCAGVSVFRLTVQPRGLVLPSYSNVPRVTYIVQGRGVLGAVLPGCAETYQSSSRTSTGEQRSSRDRHQKVRNIRQGDVVVMPAGTTYWCYNNGDQPLVVLTVYDTNNDQNQLDQSVRKFFLAGNPDEVLERDRRREQGSGQQAEKSGGNVFSGLDEQVIADAFDVETQLAQKLRSSNDGRGNVVRVRDGLEIPIPPQSREDEERRRQEGPNGLEETLCTLRLVHNIADPQRADVYNPRGGRITTVNSQVLPVLSHVQLSAERGVLYRNGLLAPQYNMNSHSVVYVTRGNGRVQIVNDNAQTVYDGEVRQGQVVVIPQNYAVVKRASNQGLEWVAVKTTDNAMISPLAGRLSVVRGLPEEVLMNSYQISREDARRLKYNREEVSVFGPGSRSQ